jgi:hypothetical protein
MRRNLDLSTIAAAVTPKRALISLALLLGLIALTAGIGTAREGATDTTSTTLPSTRPGIERLAGGPADRCVYASPGRVLCRWQVSGRLVRPITRGGVGDGNRVRIVCELPTRGEASGACQAHPAGEARLPSVAAANSPQDPFVAYATIGALSHALGDVPAHCTTLGGVQDCSWSLPSDGAESEDLDETQGMLRCLLPLDGSPRADGSCEVVAPE